ncbi:MAG: 4Fe-4S dicluster domain-containing protein [Desulfarculus sp.]|nr:MAG: 4Fe-4S dicluster domain-containing protein [Desulfarculus sp.]
MRIVTVRRISQVFFLCLFLWFCLAATLGERWWQLRGWPVNWFLDLDPLSGLLTLLTTGTIFAGLLWGLATVALTLILGRFFCGWLCPLGTMHQFVGWLGSRSKGVKERVARNAPRRAQMIKYFLLAFFLAAAAGDMLLRLGQGQWPAALAGALLMALVLGAARRGRGGRSFWLAAGALGALWLAYSLLLGRGGLLGASLLAGLLDPIPLLTRSVNLVLLPLADAPLRLAWPEARYFQGAALIGAVFIAALLLNLWLPRFYCRFVCPLGALFGLLGRFSLWRVGKTQADCSACVACDAYCEGACRPQGVIHAAECVLCLNCLDLCPDQVIDYRTAPSAAGEQVPDLSRRRVLAALGTGLVAPPLLRLGGLLGPDWDPRLVRPPGALAEGRFLARCLRCGQCMRVCPTGVLQPAGLSFGLEALWTPVLNMTIGTSGCQLRCVACGHVCPSAAIRPISVQEKLGQGPFAAQGPLRLGTAFIDRGRCLPWAMDRPCIVCQENCPVSPKAIFTRVQFNPVLPELSVARSLGGEIIVSPGGLKPGALGTGDYYCRAEGWQARITGNTADTLLLAPPQGWGPPGPGKKVSVLVRLQQPYVDPARCIGCGICQHECPVSGLRAIRVTAENASRHRSHSLLLK